MKFPLTCDAWCSTIHSEQLLGYPARAETPLANGLESMWAWAQAAWVRYPERRQRRERFTIELTEGLPTVWKKQIIFPRLSPQQAAA